MKQTPPPSIPVKKCDDCWANLPLSFYGRYHASKDGHALTCKECRHQWSSMYYTSKHGRIRPYNPEVIRRVPVRNQMVIEQILSSPNPSTFIGWMPENGRTFRIEYDTVLTSVRFVIWESSKMFQSYALNDVAPDELKHNVAYLFRGLRIRLELTEADMIAAKTLIYFL